MELVRFGIECNGEPLVYKEEVSAIKRIFNLTLTDEEEQLVKSKLITCYENKVVTEPFDVQGQTLTLKSRKFCMSEVNKFTAEDHEYSLMNREDKPGDLDWRPYCLVCDVISRAIKTPIGYKCVGCGNQTLNTLYGINRCELTFN